MKDVRCVLLCITLRRCHAVVFLCRLCPQRFVDSDTSFGADVEKDQSNHHEDKIVVVFGSVSRCACSGGSGSGGSFGSGI